MIRLLKQNLRYVVTTFLYFTQCVHIKLSQRILLRDFKKNSKGNLGNISLALRIIEKNSKEESFALTSLMVFVPK